MYVTDRIYSQISFIANRNEINYLQISCKKLFISLQTSEIKSYLQTIVNRCFSLRKRNNLSFLPFADFFFILRNPIRSGRNLRRDGHLRLITIAPTAACFYRDGFVRSLARTRINKLQRGSVMCPAFSTRPGLIPNNVPQTARRAIENKTPLTPGALFLRTGWIFLWGVYPILWSVHRESLIPSWMFRGSSASPGGTSEPLTR